jgi:penicillin amidase
MRVLRWLVVVLLVVVVGAFGVGVWLVRRSFPVTEGDATLPGLQAETTVVRDESGVPHITASTAEDLFFAQGYVHAQDRFWQMDTWRHIGAGRLSEMFGESQVETDAFLRTLGFERLAEEEYAALPDDIRTYLDAYAAGVNAYLEDRPGGAALSFEYAVLGLQNGSYEPAPWKPENTLTWAHVMAWDLRSNIEEELDRAFLAEALGPEMAEDLYPTFPADHPLIVEGESASASTGAPPDLSAAFPALERARANVSAAATAIGAPLPGIGSNSWVVDGTLTSSGLPLLANDPHLGIQLPSIWYEVSLWCEPMSPECPFRVGGFSFAGAPGVVIGHNEKIAWGFTNEGPDGMDLFIERTRGDTYEFEGAWVPLETRTEVIEVAGGDPVEIQIRSTAHGPIISDTYEPAADLPDAQEEGHEVALAWKALEPSTVFQALLGINRASNWEDFRQAAALFDIAPQNLVYADVDGHIGYQATGDIPVRRSGDGRYPVPGWTGEYEWEDSIPFEELPSVLDPASGIIVTANQPLVGDDHPLYLGADFDYGYRAARITDLLSTADALTVEDMTAIQMDEYDASAAVVVPSLLELESDDPAVTAMQDALRPWAESSDPFQMDAHSAGAAAYAALWRHLLMTTFDELPEDRPADGSSRYFAVIEQLLGDPENAWWDILSTAPVETADEVLLAAARSAQEELSERLGEDAENWEWGKLHIAPFENQTLGQSGIAPIEALFNRTITGVGGSASIVNATGWAASEGYEVLELPSMRMVVDLADFSRSVAIHTTGQSGHAFHRHYFDMAEEWARGETTRPFPFEPPADGDALRLVPGG